MVSTDILVVATVSNWGLTELWLHCPDVWDKSCFRIFLDQILHNKTVEIGSVDGVTHELTCTVDGKVC